MQHADGSDVTFEQWARARSALTKLVAPATPITIEATKPEPGSGFVGSLKKPRLVWVTIWLALLAAVGFVGFTSEPTLRRCSYLKDVDRRTVEELISNNL